MAVFQTGIAFLFAAIVLAAIAMAAILYYALFIAVMITWDGCELCQRLRQARMAKADHGHSLSRT